MNVYMFQAALYCEACGADICKRVTKPFDFDPNNESTWDSDDYPKGPYPNGGGEADYPQHCDACGTFLENPLTDDGDTYVRTLAKRFETRPDMSWEEIAKAADAGNRPALVDWIRFYFAWGQ